MVTERYPETPYISEYREIISESIEAHFLGLDHIAVAGLMPVVEGVGMTLVELWKVNKKFDNGKYKGIRPLFSDIATGCKDYVIDLQLGAVSEINQLSNHPTIKAVCEIEGIGLTPFASYS